MRLTLILFLFFITKYVIDIIDSILSGKVIKWGFYVTRIIIAGILCFFLMWLEYYSFSCQNIICKISIYNSNNVYILGIKSTKSIHKKIIIRK